MSGLLCLIPVIWDQTADKCIASILDPGSSAGIKPEEILIVDNSREGFAGKYGLRTYRDPDGHNLGTSRAWNVGAREVLDKGIDYLLVMSASMQFGAYLHTNWREQMDRFWGERVIECMGISWHCIAFHRTVFEGVGLFDTNFHVYEEGIDFSHRMSLLGWEGGWCTQWVNAVVQGVALHINMVSCPSAPLKAYYAAKWNGEKGHEKFTRPFGNKPIDYFEDVPIPVLAERYGWKTWW